MALRYQVGQGSFEIANRQLKAQVTAALREAISRYIERMTTWIRANTPVATGYLLRSGMALLSQSYVSGTSFYAYYGYNSDYARYVEEGRAPGSMPPISELKAWSFTVGLPEESVFAVARSIAKYGTVTYRRGGGGLNYDQGKVVAKKVLEEELKAAFQRRNISVNWS